MKLEPAYKKTIGLIIVIIMSCLCLILTVAIAFILIDLADGNDTYSASVFSVSFMMLIFLFPLKFGLNLIKQAKIESIKRIPCPDPDKSISFSNKLRLAEYRKLLLSLSYKNLFVLYLSVLGVFIILAPVFSDTSEKTLLSVGLGLLFLSSPFLSFFQANWNYKSNKNLQEQIEYQINVDNLILKGENFNSTIRWEAIHKVKELKGWYLLYTSNVIAILIPKRYFNSAEEEEIFRGFILNTENVKKELIF